MAPKSSPTIMSKLPSLFRSPTVIGSGRLVFGGNGSDVGAPNVPSPFPNNTATPGEVVVRLATATSGLPSWLKSPVIRAKGESPAANVDGGPKPCDEFPSNTTTPEPEIAAIST